MELSGLINDKYRNKPKGEFDKVKVINLNEVRHKMEAWEKKSLRVYLALSLGQRIKESELTFCG